MEWFVLALKKYAIFEGRSRRKEYWMFYLITTLISIPLGIIDSIIGSIGQTNLGFLGSLFSIFTFLPQISVSVRRLHDVNKSGWYLLLIFLPIIGWIWLFILTVKEGDAGDNKYGTDPKNPISELDEIGISQS